MMDLKSYFLELNKKQLDYFNEGITLSVEFRKSQLLLLKKAIEAYQDEISEALLVDLGKSEFESYTTEIGFVLSELKHTIKHIGKWSADINVNSPMALLI